MAFITYPLNNILYTAEDAELFHVTRTSGVYAKNSFDCSVTGASNSITIGQGVGWIKNGDFSGKVIAQKESVTLDMGVADSQFPRIDAVVIQFNANNNVTSLIVKEGVASSSPVAPSVTRTEAVYELHLYHVRREAGAASISVGSVIDLRLNSLYCGLMGDSVTQIDTANIERQINDLIERLEAKLSEAESNSNYLLVNGENAMQAPLDMGGYGFNNVKAPVDSTDLVNKGYVDENYEVSGLSHGHYSVASADELDALLTTLMEGIERRKTRYFTVYTSNAASGLPRSDTWFLEISKKTDSNGYVIARTTTASNGVYELNRIMSSDIWQPWEHVNPNLTVGTEYRTTERHAGKAVYQKLVNFGAMPSDNTKSVAHGVSNVHRVLDAQIIATNTVSLLTNHNVITDFVVNDTNIQIKATLEAMLYEDSVVWMKYTKN